MDVNTAPKLWVPFYMKCPKVSKMNWPLEFNVIIFGSDPFKLNGSRFFKGLKRMLKYTLPPRGMVFVAVRPVSFKRVDV